MNPDDSKRKQASERAHHDEGGAAMIGIYDVSEADEAATSKETALENLREQVVNDEATAVIDMYERAAWAVGATVRETERVIVAANTARLARKAVR